MATRLRRLVQRRRVYLWSAVIVLAVSVSAVPNVFAQKIETEFDPSVDFTRFKTFAIREGRLNSPSPALNSELTRKRIESEIEKALIARVETETFPAGWRGRRTRVARVPYSEGTLVIDLRDPSSRSLVWRGMANEEEPNPTKLADKLDEMVKKSIAKYPPKK